MVFEDLRSREAEYARSFLSFVGVTPEFPIMGSEVFRLEASLPRSRLLAKALKAGARLVRTMGRPWIIQRIKESAIPSLVFRRVKPEERPVVSADDKEYLRSQFCDDTGRLSALLGRNLTLEWFGNVE
jgi:hypothetical protein